MAYIRYKGSPDVFDETTGRYISDVEAQKIANFDTQVKDVNVIRPDIQTEADFAKLSGTNVALSPTPTPTAPSTSPVSPEDKPYVEATNPPVTPQSPEQPQNNQQPIQDKTLAMSPLGVRFRPKEVFLMLHCQHKVSNPFKSEASLAHSNLDAWEMMFMR